MLVALIVNRRPGAEFVLIAPTKEIANYAFRQVSRTIRSDPELDKLFHIMGYGKTIVHKDQSNGSQLQIKAADTDVITGSKASGILIDETHVFAEKPKAPDVFLEIRGAFNARPDGFLIQITTQSKNQPSGIFKKELSWARDVRDGKVVDAKGRPTNVPFLPILYELPEDLVENDGWKDRSTWKLLNPNLGLSVDQEFLERETFKAERNGMAAVALHASQYFNVEIGVGLKTDGWAGAIFWEKNASLSMDLDVLIECSEVIVSGVDGGGLDDLFSVCFIGRKKGTREWLQWEHTWCHKIVLERRKSEAPKLLDFAEDGTLTIVDDMTVAFNQAADMIAKVEKTRKLDKIGLDPVCVGLIIDALALRGIKNPADGESGVIKLLAVSQGYRMMGAIKTAEVKLASGELTHSGHPIMAWAAGNAKVEPKGNAITITKQNAGTAKIDPLMAMFDAVHLMSLNPLPLSSSYMSKSKLLVLS